MRLSRNLLRLLERKRRFFEEMFKTERSLFHLKLSSIFNAFLSLYSLLILSFYVDVLITFLYINLSFG